MIFIEEEGKELERSTVCSIINLGLCSSSYNAQILHFILFFLNIHILLQNEDTP
jgi:hypothetical protein